MGGGIEIQDNETLAVSFPGSPGSFKWDGHGSFSPLASGKRISQVCAFFFITRVECICL